MASDPMASSPVLHSPLIPCLFLIAACIFVRLCIGLHPYSGQGLSPRFGDYEAQRHWMELTIHLPATQWYVQGPHNNLDYWGIDYPPLTAYQVIQWWAPDAMALDVSHGYESYESKLLMRWSVIVCDVLCFFPCALAFVWTYYKNRPPRLKLWALAVICLQPPLLLIDHGHFQYNAISLGLTVGAATAVLANRDILGSVLFCLALNHKQMALYFAPAFFATLLGKALRRTTVAAKIAAVGRLGVTVVATFALVWAPFLYPDPSAAAPVLQRLAPVHRGLYEDYVANWWCVSGLAGIKWKRLLTQQQLVGVCAATTAIAFVPALVQQVLRPSPRGLLLCMANSAMAFFLFSYMVHEKSILLPLLPITMLALDEPALAAWLPAIGATSMFPLLLKDGLPIAYIGTLLLWAALVWPPHDNGDVVPSTSQRWWRLVAGASTMAAGVVHGAHVVVAAPARYPFLYDALYSSLGFANVLLAAMYTNARQWQQGGAVPPRRKRQ